MSSDSAVLEADTKRAALGELLRQIDLDEVIRRRSVQEAIGRALAETWFRRARDFDAARPRPGDFTGRASAEQLARADERCRATAAALRAKGTMILQDRGWFDD